MRESVLILDFGSQYTQLIARRIRELGVFSEIKPCYAKVAEVDDHVKAVIFSGGPSSVTGPDAPEFDPSWFDLKIPMLGVCYGMQLMAHHFGGELAGGERREYGHADLEVNEGSKLFKNVGENSRTAVWMSHGDHVDVLPEGFKISGSSDGLPIAAMERDSDSKYAVQFHPEVVHSRDGKKILQNFLFEIAKLDGGWTSANFIDEAISSIRNTVPEDANVICGLSGGVDSTVAAVLVDKAIGERLVCIFVDNGLLRKNEGDQVEKRLGASGLGLNLIRVNAGARFLKELEGVTDPEQKRKIIGRVFVEVFDEEAKKISKVTHLVQGTLYPDVIESVSVKGPSATIKTHHNVGGLPEKMNLKLLEPFRELFKDEVRAIGRELKVPEELVQRQPFPGPGLAVRILGDITNERVRVLQEADAIFVEEVRKAGLYNELWQSFAVLLPINSVGVMGDYRTYEQAVALRAVTSQDGMTADWAYLPREVLATVSNKIIRQVKGINRVVLDISSKPPATIEWE